MSSTFEDWPFLSVHFWGEDPTGEWQLEISNAGTKQASADGILKHWQLVLYGTEDNPVSTFTPSLPLAGTTHKSSADISYSPADSGNNKLSDKASKNTPEPQSLLPKSPPYICHSECTSVCTGPRSEHCNHCRNFVLNNMCVKVCPFGTYGSLPRHVPGSTNQSNSSIRLCLACHPNCAACFGPGRDHCLECKQDMLLLSDHSECVPSCPDGYAAAAADQKERKCEACSSQCDTCSSTKTCTSCPAPLVMSDNSSCQALCGGEEYREGDRCKPCHESCKTCVGGKDTQCGRCKEGFYFERRCVPYCPVGYASDITRGECLPCPTGCDQCQADGGVCTTCRQGWIKTPEELCLPPKSVECQPGMYSGKGTCLACHDSCETCVGPKDTGCSSCYPDHKLRISTCVLTCPDSTKLSSAGHSCLCILSEYKLHFL